MTRSTTDPYHAVRHFSAAPWPGPRGELVRLTSDAVESIIAPADGCRLVSLRAFGHELLRQWDPERRAFQYGSFPMIPWVGRLDCGILRYQRREYHLPVNKPPHALHGMACFGPWQQQGVGSFSYRLDDPWPWPGTVTQTFDVLADGLATTLTVTSDEATFPAAAGWHPWFRRQLDEAHGPDQALQIDVMPGWLKAISKVNPLSYEVDGLRALMLRSGHTQFGLAGDYLALVAMIAVFTVVATRMYPRLTQ